MFAKKIAGSQMESEADAKKEFRPFERGKGRRSKKHGGKRTSKRS
jgi:hypothetical protein